MWSNSLLSKGDLQVSNARYSVCTHKIYIAIALLASLLYVAGQRVIAMSSINPATTSMSPNQTISTTSAPENNQEFSNSLESTGASSIGSGASASTLVSSTPISTDVSVEVNGQSIDVPANGSTHTTVSNSNGSEVNVSVNSSSSSSAQSNGYSFNSFNVSTSMINNSNTYGSTAQTP